MICAAYKLNFTCFRPTEEEDINAPPPQIQAAIKSNDIGNLLDLDWDDPGAGAPSSSSKTSAQNDLQDLFSPTSPQSPVAPKAKAKAKANDIMDLFGSSAPSAPQQPIFQQQAFHQSPPQQHQQQQNLFGGDLLFDAQPTGQTSPPQQHQQQKRPEKDPFADLF